MSARKPQQGDGLDDDTLLRKMDMLHTVSAKKQAVEAARLARPRSVASRLCAAMPATRRRAFSSTSRRGLLTRISPAFPVLEAQWEQRPPHRPSLHTPLLIRTPREVGS